MIEPEKAEKGKYMKGLELAELYYREHGRPMVLEKFGGCSGRIAAGFVGPGSECFGFDDEISRDHDWGPGFCLWLTGDDYKEIGPGLQEEYGRLPRVFMGFGPRVVSPGEEGRTGVSETSGFYKKYTGLDHPPRNLREWMYIPEQALATCTNGKVFSDSLGEFSGWRDSLAAFYPEDVRLKRIASRCMTVAQSGQYNYTRSIRRKEYFAALFDEARFCADVMSLVFLLNRRYTPFYKWMHRAVKSLPVLGEAVHRRISGIAESERPEEKEKLIEETCSLIVQELKSEGLTASSSDFLADHSREVQSRISDRELRESFFILK
jgi:hypothetical protein